MKNNIWFTKDEIIDKIKDYLVGYDDFNNMINVDELHYVIANKDYYITYYDDAIDALYEYGYQNALDKIINYLDDIIDEDDFKDLVRVCNLLWYVLAQEFIFNELSNFEYELSIDEIQKRLNKIERGILK